MDSDSDIGDTIVVKPRAASQKPPSSTTRPKKQFASSAIIEDSDSEGADMVTSATTTNDIEPRNTTATSTTRSMALNSAYHPGDSDDISSESSLSTRSPTPPPPTPPALATIPLPPTATLPRRIYEVECTHLDRCDCPKHAGYDAGVYIDHLSEWAINNIQYPESALRSTIAREAEAKHAATKANVMEFLVTMQGGPKYVSEEVARGKAGVFVKLVEKYLPRGKILEGEGTVMELLLGAFEELKVEGDWWRLVGRVEKALAGDTGVMGAFREILPEGV